MTIRLLKKRSIKMSKRRSNSIKDAELYLSTIGIPRGLPIINMFLYGTQTPLRPGTVLGHFKDTSVHSKAPFVYMSSNNVLLCLDPDAPIRNKDGSKPGKFGPRLHWLKRGHEDIVKYKGPSPSEGKHRYVFILFEEVKKNKKTRL